MSSFPGSTASADRSVRAACAELLQCLSQLSSDAERPRVQALAALVREGHTPADLAFDAAEIAARVVPNAMSRSPDVGDAVHALVGALAAVSRPEPALEQAIGDLGRSVPVQLAPRDARRVAQAARELIRSASPGRRQAVVAARTRARLVGEMDQLVGALDSPDPRVRSFAMTRLRDRVAALGELEECEQRMAS
jgi:hypothetical protein